MLKDTKIGKKLVGGFLIVAFISVIIGYVGYSGMGMMEVHLDQITEVRLPSIEALDVIVAGQIALKASERTLLIKGVDAAQQQQQFKQVEETWERIEAAWKKYEPLEQTREALSHSKIGYIYYYNEDSREFILNTWSRDVMEQCGSSPKFAVNYLRSLTFFSLQWQ